MAANCHMYLAKKYLHAIGAQCLFIGNGEINETNYSNMDLIKFMEYGL